MEEIIKRLIKISKDDRKILERIKDVLACGRLNTERNTLVFSISQLSDIETILIPLFEKFPLNTTKYLDYLDFKKAFFLFKNRKSNELSIIQIYSNILELKQNMNSNRVNFVLPANHNIRITGNYLVGFLALQLQVAGGREAEGDGSFYLNKPYFSLFYPY
jgi:hypothetical protein